MKFLCLDCDEPMKLLKAEGPDEGSLSVVFRCPECGFRVAMLTNPFETQLVRSLGVKVGGRTVPAEAFDNVRTSGASARPDAFVGVPTPTAETEGPGCPFAAMMNEGDMSAPAGVQWTTEAEARLERIPAFIRSMARKAIERYAEGKGYPSITETVMDEARGAMGM